MTASTTGVSCHCGSWWLADRFPVIDEGWYHGSESCYRDNDYIDPGHVPSPPRKRWDAAAIPEWQPYARHYMHTHDFTDAQRFKGVEFMAWMDKRWQEFADHIGQPREKVRSSTHGDAFGAWLAQGCPCGGAQ